MDTWLHYETRALVDVVRFVDDKIKSVERGAHHDLPVTEAKVAANRGP